MTRKEAHDLAAERGHNLERMTSEGSRVEIHRCAQCGARLVFFELNVYGGALERQCSTTNRSAA